LIAASAIAAPLFILLPQEIKAPCNKRQRHVPRDLNARITLNYAPRSETWRGGLIDEKHLPSEMPGDYIRVSQTLWN